jgi:hypothetical protein
MAAALGTVVISEAPESAGEGKRTWEKVVLEKWARGGKMSNIQMKKQSGVRKGLVLADLRVDIGQQRCHYLCEDIHNRCMLDCVYEAPCKEMPQ